MAPVQALLQSRSSILGDFCNPIRFHPNTKSLKAVDLSGVCIQLQISA